MPRDIDTHDMSPILDDLLSLTEAALDPLDELLTRATASVAALTTRDGRPDAALIEEHQTAAHGLAWLATYAQALRQMHGWAAALEAEGRLTEIERLILQIAFGEYLWPAYGGIPMSQGEIVRLQDLGVSQDDQRGLMAPAVMTLCAEGNSQAARMRLAELLASNAHITHGASGLDDELEMIREQFRRFVVDRIAPDAHGWHLRDELIPMEIISEMAEMGVFGLTIPEEHGGLGLPKAAMCVVSEELSRGYIGVGSLGTRSEIAAELILCGGTEAQKAH